MGGASLKYRRAFKAIREVLNAEWNPIGFGSLPEDEYDSYIPAIYRLITDGADDQVLSKHLDRLETFNMGLPSGGERNVQIAARLRQVIESSEDSP